MRSPADSAAPGSWLWFPGVWWDGVDGTDKHLARAVAERHHVIWVDPSLSWADPRARGRPWSSITGVHERITRVSTVAPPGVTRPGLRQISRALVMRNARRAVARSGRGVDAIMLSTPEQEFPRWAASAKRLYYETDDFVAGAQLLGMPRAALARSRLRNSARSDVVLAVTPEILASIGAGDRGRVLPNGCDPARFGSSSSPPPAIPPIELPSPRAGVVGQLNERLDMRLLEAVVDSGANLLLVGPRSETTSSFRHALDALIERANVQWIDRLAFEAMPAVMEKIAVGLTPYTKTAFNLGSFPLKTLDYLAAGLPVVSTDLPSARSLGSPDVFLADDVTSFREATLRCLREQPGREAGVQRRRAFAQSQSWSERADTLSAIVDLGDAHLRKHGTRG